MKEITNTGLLVSVHHSYNTSANLEVFDVSRKGQVKQIYSFEEVFGCSIIFNVHRIIILVTGHGDVTYNPRRNILGAVPVRGKITYHLNDIAAGKGGNYVKLIRKSKWHSQYSKERSINNFFPIADSTDLLRGNHIASLDFNPNGETVATFDSFGTCLLSDVNTHNYSFHMKMNVKQPDDEGRQIFLGP